jgi:hypothetical protein
VSFAETVTPTVSESLPPASISSVFTASRSSSASLSALASASTQPQPSDSAVESLTVSLSSPQSPTSFEQGQSASVSPSLTGTVSISSSGTRSTSVSRSVSLTASQTPSRTPSATSSLSRGASVSPSPSSSESFGYDCGGVDWASQLQCGNGTFASCSVYIGPACLACDDSCETCRGGTIFDCNSCYDGFMLIQGSQCVGACSRSVRTLLSVCFCGWLFVVYDMLRVLCVQNLRRHRCSH